MGESEPRPRSWPAWAEPVLVVLVALAIRLAARPLLDQPTFYFAKYPTLGDEFLRGEGPAQQAFTASPLYLYFWYLMHVVFPGRLGMVIVVQMICGALACGLLCAAGATLFDRRTGLLAGLAAAAYLPFLANDASFVSEGLVVLVNTAALTFLALALRDGEPGFAAAAGLALGLSGAARPNAVLLIPFLAAPLWLAVAGSRRRRLGLVGLFVALALAGPLLITWRNARVSGAPVFVMSDGGLVFYIGNNELDRGLSYTWPRHVDLTLNLPGEVDPAHRIARAVAEAETGRKLDANEDAAFWLAEGWRFIRQHPGEYLALLLRKLDYFWRALEPHDVQTTWEQERALRHWPLLRFGWVAPFALLGLVVSAADWRRLLPWYGILLAYTATGLLFTVVTRYRLPMVPAVLLWAAVGLGWLWDHTRARHWRRVGPAAAAVLLAAAWINHGDYWTRSFQAEYEAAGGPGNRARLAMSQGDWDRAEALYRELEAARPTFSMVATARGALAEIALRRGDRAAAQAWLALALGPLLPDQIPADLPPTGVLADRVGREPDDVEGWLLLGARQWQDGQPAAAERSFRAAARRVPAFAPAHYNRAVCLAALDRPLEAERWALAARRLRPTIRPIHDLCVRLGVQNRGAAAVVAEYANLARAYPEVPGFRYGLALARRAEGSP